MTDVNTKKLMEDFTVDVNDVIESTIKVKGEAFANAVAGLFELMEVGECLGVAAAAATAGGIDVLPHTRPAAVLIGSVASRLTVGLEPSDADEAVALAYSLMGRRVGVNLKVQATAGEVQS